MGDGLERRGQKSQLGEKPLHENNPCKEIQIAAQRCSCDHPLDKSEYCRELFDAFKECKKRWQKSRRQPRKADI